MVHPHIRFKINLSMAATALAFVTMMWIFNTEVVNRDWISALEDLPLFAVIVGGLVVVAVFVNHSLLAPLVACLKTIETGGRPDPVERRRALVAMLRLPAVIIVLNVLGFFFGPLGRLIPAALAKGTSLFLPVPLLTVVYNVIIGFICSLIIILENSVLLSGAKRILNVASRDELAAGDGRRMSDMSLRLKNVLFPFGLAMLFGAMMGVAGFSVYSREIRSSAAVPPTAAAIAPTEAAGAATASAAGDPFLQKEWDYLLTSGVFFLILLAFSLALSLFFSSETSSYLKTFSANLARLLAGEGDLSRRLPLVQYNELGDLAALYNRLIDTLRGLLGRVRAEAERTASTSEELNRFIEKCSASSAEISESAGRVNAEAERQANAVGSATHAIGEILSSIENVKGSVSTQASFIEETSSAINQMSANIASVTTSSREARSLSDSLVTLARDGEEKVGRTIEAIEGIEKASRLVTEIVAVISRIAGQTNLLAMNASIEAAHAGSFGQGFSVVADEVKKLAEESSQSAIQIESEMEAMTRSVSDGAALSRTTGEALSRIASDINKSTVLMTSIARAMEEQDAGAREILDSVGSIIQTTQHIQAQTEDQFARSTKIRENMDLLVGSAADIRTAARSQGTNLNVLKEAIEELGKVTMKNREVVGELNRAVGKFKIE